MSSIIPYLTFNGNCEEAMNFYVACFDGKLISLQHFSDSPMPYDEADKNNVLHSVAELDGGAIMASDAMPGVHYAGNNVSLTLNMTDIARMESVFNKLAEGGEITMALQDTFWGARFGMVKDKYGFHWMFNAETKK